MKFHIGMPFLALVLVSLLGGTAFGQTKFENKDTATNRQDYTWGTRKADDAPGGYFETTEQGNDSWGNDLAPEAPPRDWYDEVIITVSPDVGYGTKTTTTESTNSSGEVTGGTTTTTTY
ncbi:MAG: hypothetical protein KKB70_11065 [Proteobacteria bacterium]|nr:hypothetical protein [Pseudomonadota bacterium]MBU1611931.1 hypothetical protein [Pseudomonadota bacterium]